VSVGGKTIRTHDAAQMYMLYTAIAQGFRRGLFLDV
jgi:hypothetical protein